MRCNVVLYCSFLIFITSSVTNVVSASDSCVEIGKVLTEKFQKHVVPMDVQNLYTCNRGVTCCNSISEYFFKKSVSETFTNFALFTVTRLLDNFKDGVYAQQINWEVFSSLIQQVENGSNISYEHFFELALLELMPISKNCLSRKETKAFKSEAMTDIVSLVNNIYVYKQGVEAINVTLQATASLKPSKECTSNVSKAGIPLDLKYQSSGCPLCLDSTSNVKVCKDLCLNVVRGCYASILLYKDLFLELVREMDTAYFNLNYNLEMQNGSLFSFIDKIQKHLRTEPFASECPSDSRNGGDQRRRKRRKRQSGRPDLSQWREFFSKQLALDTAIIDPATLPCAHSNNTTPCWNGYSSGSYKHLSYAYTKEEQEINPEGADMELTEELESAVKLMRKALDLLNTTSHGEHLLPLFKIPETVETTTLQVSYPPSGEQNFDPLPVTSPGGGNPQGNNTDLFHGGFTKQDRLTPRANTKGAYTIGRVSRANNYLGEITSEPTHYRFNNNSIEGESEASISGSHRHITGDYRYSLVFMTFLISVFIGR